MERCHPQSTTLSPVRSNVSGNTLPVVCLLVVLTAFYSEGKSSSLQERKKCVVFVHLIVLQLRKLHGVPHMTKTDCAVNT